MYSSRKYPYSPHTRGWILPGVKGRDFCKTKTFKEIYEALLEFREGWGSENIYTFPTEGIFSETILYAIYVNL